MQIPSFAITPFLKECDCLLALRKLPALKSDEHFKQKHQTYCFHDFVVYNIIVG